MSISVTPLVLLADDNEGLTSALARHLQRSGFTVHTVREGGAAMHALRECAYAAVVLDLGMEPVPGWEVLERLAEQEPSPPVVVLSGQLDVAATVRAMRLGAVDVVEKPILPEVLVERLRAVIGEHGEPDELESEPDDVVRRLLLGGSPMLRRLREDVRRVARFRDVSVLIEGETGTGKEVVAEAIHRASQVGGDFIGVNCAAIPQTLFEGEFFGHAQGAFTGAREAREGLLEAARGGTLFLDEVGEMPAPVQAKLLRVLESRRYRRIGSNTDRPFEARVVSATNRRLDSGKYMRPDLYYRLSGFTFFLPPLRERMDDLPILATHFFAGFAERHPEAARRFAPGALRVLQAHEWPGNVRELRAVVEQAVMVAGSRDEVRPRDVQQVLEQRLGGNGGARPGLSKATPDALSEDETLPELERRLTLQAMEECGGNVSQAARRLGIPRSTLRTRLGRWGLG